MGVSRCPSAFAGDLPSLWGSADAVPFAAVMLNSDKHGVDGELGCCPGSDSCSQWGGQAGDGPEQRIWGRVLEGALGVVS